jgi:hypothetical protein
MTKLLVAGGASDETTFLTSVEVVNLDDSNPDVTCQNLPDLPATIFGAAGKSLSTLLIFNFSYFLLLTKFHHLLYIRFVEDWVRTWRDSNSLTSKSKPSLVDV